MKQLVKCWWCDQVFPENEILYTKDPDELMCPKCRTIEPGFATVSEITIEEVSNV